LSASERSAARSSEAAAGGCERTRIDPRRTRQLDRREIVVREQVGVVVRPAERLDPLGCDAMPFDPPGARDRAIGDIAQQDVPKGVLVLPRHGAAALAADELPPFQLVEPFLELEPVAPGDRLEGGRPEDLADDGGVLEQLLVRRIERVDARRDDPLHRLGELEPSRPALTRHAHELLGVERIAAGTLEERDLHLRGKNRALEQGVHEPRRILVGERAERERDGVCLAAAPGGAPRKQLRAGGGDEEDRNVG
jgi:hypothetical protein